MTASAEFTVDEDHSYFRNIEAEDLMYSFDIDAYPAEGYLAFIDINIRSSKTSAPITVTVGKRQNQVGRVHHLAINDRHGYPLDPDMPDMAVSAFYS